MRNRSFSALVALFTLVTALGLAGAPAAGAAEPLTLEAQVLGVSTDDHPSVEGIVFTGYAGAAYELTWTVVDAQGTPAEGGPAGSLAGTTDPDGSIRFPIDGSTLAEGTWFVAGSVTLDHPTYGQFAGDIPAGQGEFAVDRTAPVVSTFTASRSFVRAGATSSYGSVTITATGSGGTDSPGIIQDGIDVIAPSGVVRDVLYPDYVDGRWTATFHGRDAYWNLLPRGTYTLRLHDAGGNTAPASLQVAVQRLERKTFERTLTVTGSQVDKYVGACSRLATPASRGWSGSHGYYGNTRCDSTRPARTAVLTVHRVYVPSAAKYHDFRVTPYSGASRGAAGSVGVLGYLTKADEQVDPVRLGPALGPHTGAPTPLAPLVRPGRAVRFFVGTAGFNRYDVRSFTVVAHYSVWR